MPFDIEKKIQEIRKLIGDTKNNKLFNTKYRQKSKGENEHKKSEKK